MRERIELVSFEMGTVNHVATSTQRTSHGARWAEVPKVPIREAVDQTTKLDNRKDSPVFIVRFTPAEIQPEWCVSWRGNLYDITGLDPDYQKRDITTITTKKRGPDDGSQNYG